MSTNLEILWQLNHLVHSHEKAKKLLITVVNRSKLRYLQKWRDGVDDDKLVSTLNCTLIAKSVTGKTHLIESLAKVMDFPFVKVDASQFTRTSASGGISQESLRSTIRKKAKEYVEISTFLRDGRYNSIDGVIDQMIVFVDEVCKLAYTATANSSWQKETQGGFLTTFDKYAEFAGVSFIFAGAFSGLDYKNSDLSQKSIGFVTNADKKTESSSDLDQKLIQYGLIPELVGRMGVICALDDLQESDYYSILVDRLLSAKQMQLYYIGINDFDISNADIDSIVKDAMKSGLGVRYMQQRLDNIAIEYEFNHGLSPDYFIKKRLKLDDTTEFEEIIL